MPEKKKILYIITKSNWGGAQKYVFDLATSIPKEKYESVVAFGGNGSLKNKLEEAEIRTIQIKHLQRDISILKEIRVFFEILHIYKKEKPDIVHLNSSKIGLGALAARTSGINKIIFTAHGWAFNEKRNFISRLLIWKLSWLTALICTDVITLSEKEQNQAKNFPLISDRKIHLIRNGIKAEKLLSREEALEKLKLNPGKKYVGTISELHKNKGLENLIRASLYIKADIIIIGSGEEEHKLKNMARNLGILGRIHFLGPINHAGLYVKAFDVFTLTSRKEGLPYVLLEAGYGGIPSVASCIGGIPEIIIDQKTGLLSKPNNPNDVKEKVKKLLQDKEYSQKLGENAQRHIRENFMFEKTLELTLGIYKN